MHFVTLVASVTSSNALVTNSDALVASSFLLLVAMHKLLVARCLFWKVGPCWSSGYSPTLKQTAAMAACLVPKTLAHI